MTCRPEGPLKGFKQIGDTDVDTCAAVQKMNSKKRKVDTGILC